MQLNTSISLQAFSNTKSSLMKKSARLEHFFAIKNKHDLLYMHLDLKDWEHHQLDNGHHGQKSSKFKRSSYTNDSIKYNQ